MSDLKNASEEELINELAERKICFERVETMPLPLDKFDFSKVLELCKGHLLEMAKADYCEDNDDAHHIYEAAMEAVYGEKVWVWINNIL